MLVVISCGTALSPGDTPCGSKVFGLLESKMFQHQTGLVRETISDNPKPEAKKKYSLLKQVKRREE